MNKWEQLLDKEKYRPDTITFLQELYKKHDGYHIVDGLCSSYNNLLLVGRSIRLHGSYNTLILGPHVRKIDACTTNLLIRVSDEVFDAIVASSYGQNIDLEELHDRLARTDLKNVKIDRTHIPK